MCFQFNFPLLNNVELKKNQIKIKLLLIVCFASSWDIVRFCAEMLWYEE